MIKKIFRKALSSLPSNTKFKLARSLNSQLDYKQKAQLGQQSLLNALNKTKDLGFNPSCVIDIGAHNGDWTLEAREVFPDQEYLLFEPLPHKKAILHEKFDNTKTAIYNVLLGNEEKKDVPFYSMESGSSVYEELTEFDREKILLDMHRLDSLTAKHELGDNVLLKIDVQGFELEVFKGAVNTLSVTNMICMEVGLLDYNSSGPLINEVIQAMSDYGFIPYDFIGFYRKSNDQALIQTDMLFIKKDSMLRKATNRFDQKDFQVVKQ